LKISKGGVSIKGIKLTVAFAMLLALMVSIPTGMAATEEDINDSINAGVAWLVEQQNETDGSWGVYKEYYPPNGTYKVAATGFALVKLEDRSRELGFEPLDPKGPYYDNISRGLSYLESQKINEDITGDLADKNNNGNAVHFTDEGGFHETYSTGIALMAIANSGMVTADVQDMVDWFIKYQNPDGGWIYYPDVFWPNSDNSNTGYAVLGLAYAEAYGADIEDVKAGLNSWVDYIQNDPGPADDGFENDPDGGSGYVSPDNWVNILKTGNLIFEAGLVGDNASSPRVQAAVDYIVRHWDDANPDPGWRPNHYQSMYATMKGLEYLQIDEIGGIDWFDNFSTVIVDTQNVTDGSWPADNWGDSMLSTVWALLTLEKVTIDRTPPEVWCIETVNPHGKNIPPAGSTTLPGPKGGQNEDGFYELFAEDNKDPEPEIFVVDSITGVTFGPYENGTKIKYTEAKGATPSEKKMGSDKGQAGAIYWHIKGQGDMILMAIDDSGNVGSCDYCLVPPKPK
jgi:hypothetical protein